jgi:hypothetical protein
MKKIPAAQLAATIAAATVFLVMNVSITRAENLSSSWEFETGIYAFIPGYVNGDSTVDGGTVPLDLDMSDVFDILDFAAAGRFEGWKDTQSGDDSAFGFVVDVSYVSLKPGATAGGGSVEVDIKQVYVDALAGYRFSPVTMDNTSDQTVTFDVTGGVRYNYLKQEIAVTPGLTPPFTVNLGTSKDWFEPVIGARANYRINDRWNLILRGDIAGFDINDSMEWSVTGLASWRAWENTSLRFGYRIYDIDYSTGSGSNEFGLDVTEHGPFFGVSYRF